jgi:uncharacterized membrane protein YhaH (DUF805 family)
MNWYLKVLKQYADFSGRARRKEYWLFCLFNVVFFIAAIILGNGNLLSTTSGAEQSMGGHYWLLYCSLYILAVLIPSLAVAVRRLHDIGKSGWNYLISLVPFAGVIVLLVWFCTDSQSGENKWGANPKE